jgi:hypothetical protein
MIIYHLFEQFKLCYGTAVYENWYTWALMLLPRILSFRGSRDNFDLTSP